MALKSGLATCNCFSFFSSTAMFVYAKYRRDQFLRNHCRDRVIWNHLPMETRSLFFAKACSHLARNSVYKPIVSPIEPTPMSTMISPLRCSTRGWFQAPLVRIIVMELLAFSKKVEPPQGP